VISRSSRFRPLLMAAPRAFSNSLHEQAVESRLGLGLRLRR
jgi:hypothetical protein